MRTEAQIAASRANGRQIQRPITAIGRAMSAQNSTVDGLAGHKLIVIEGESTDCWQSLLEARHREFQRETEIETELVTEIAAARDLGHNMRLMGRYVTRMRRRCERALENLYQPRARRHRKFPNEPKNFVE